MFFLCLYVFHIKAVCEGTGIFLIMVIFQKAFHVLFMLSLVLCSAGFVFLSLCFCRFFCFLKLKTINFVNPFFSVCQQIMNFKFSILSLPALKPIQPYLRIRL